MNHLPPTLPTKTLVEKKTTHALIKLGIITAGTQIATTLLHKVASRPLLVLSAGFLVGAYSYKRRAHIIEAQQHAADMKSKT